MDFNVIWQILVNRGRVAHFYKEECQFLWNQFTPEQQKQIFEAIERKVNSGRFVHYNPVNAIRDNIPVERGPKQLSFDDYFRRYRTTEERDGWRRVFMPKEQKTVYVK